MQVLNFASIQNFTHVLDLVGPFPATIISSFTGIIEVRAEHDFTSLQFPNAMVAVSQPLIAFTPANIGRFYAQWTGLHPSAIIEVRRYPDNSAVIGHAPIAIMPATTAIEFYASNVDITDYRLFLPPALFPGYSSDGTSITIPISTLPGLAVAEADTVTGDWREVFRAMLLRSFDYSQLFIDQPRNEQTETYKIHKSDLYAGSSKTFFTVKFLVNMGAQNVADEL